MIKFPAHVYDGMRKYILAIMKTSGELFYHDAYSIFQYREGKIKIRYGYYLPKKGIMISSNRLVRTELEKKVLQVLGIRDIHLDYTLLKDEIRHKIWNILLGKRNLVKISSTKGRS